MTTTTRPSTELFEEAKRYIPGGVNSPVRSFSSVGGTPRFIERGDGPYIFDVEGRRYIDYVCSWGPLILGHRPREVLAALSEAMERGTTFGAATRAETDLARLVVELVPGIELVRMVNSGTEATMSAVRLARGFTGRQKIIKFTGCYHGHADPFLVEAGSGMATLGLPGSPGVPETATSATLVCPYNDAATLESIFETHGPEVAAVILEPIAANMGVVPPEPGFLQSVAKLCRQAGALVIFDEVITGFRVALGGAQELYGLTPDLTCLGKIIGGGLPVGAYGGRRDVMEMVSPAGPVYQAGTLSGNPLAMAAGLATLRALKAPGLYDTLERRSRRLAEGLAERARANGVPFRVNRVGSLLTPFFSLRPVRSYEDAKNCDRDAYRVFFWTMLERGVYLAPSPFEAMFVSLAHRDEDIDETIESAGAAFAAVAEAN
ncbi:MAG: glutamate-1-semialdehyde-2,1-aminomutase [Bacillota bacterium]|nr:MAG: glutamate-1-semialdehyde-2,1-aminomutase [Bacillota bacterium]